MSFPKQRDVEGPLLKVLAELGGAAKPRDVYPRVAECFPQLTKVDIDERLPSNHSTRKWWNLVQWARQTLVEEGAIDRSTRGVWKLTDTGRQKLGAGEHNTRLAHGDLKALVNAHHEAMVSRIITDLNGLTPAGFERFCLSLLEGLGYEDVVVTGKSGDGGIDGYGDYRQGIVKIKSAFQAKRWKQSPVGRPEIDKFRGAIQGDYDHGLFLTTNTFTRDAQQASVKKGAITILLLDGNAIANHMIGSGIGVKKKPVFLMDVDDDFFTFERDESERQGRVGI